MFNALNRSDVYAVRPTTFATAAYLQPSSVLQGRILRVATQVRW